MDVIAHAASHQRVGRAPHERGERPVRSQDPAATPLGNPDENRSRRSVAEEIAHRPSIIEAAETASSSKVMRRAMA
jgi:hypothetical protein